MRNKRIWWMLAVAFVTAQCSFAAGSVPPLVRPYSYIRTFGIDFNFPGDPRSYQKEVTTCWTYDWIAFEDGYWIQPDYHGEYLEAWDHITWSNPVWPATNAAGWWEAWQGEDYNTGELIEGLPATLSFQYEYADYSYNSYNEPDGTISHWNTTRTTLHLLTGGPDASSAMNFFKLTAHATPLPGSGAIPGANLLVNTVACDANGVVYHAFPDNDEFIVTVHAEQAG